MLIYCCFLEYYGNIIVIICRTYLLVKNGTETCKTMITKYHAYGNVIVTLYQCYLVMFGVMY